MTTLYDPTTWNEGGAPGISATLLNKIENGIRGATPIGSVISSFQDAAPPGFLKLNGATVNRADYPELWDYIVANNLDDGAPFGNGNGSTTFVLPNCTQRFPRMPASGAGDGQGGSGRHTHSHSLGSIAHTYRSVTQPFDAEPYPHLGVRVRQVGSHIYRDPIPQKVHRELDSQPGR